MEKLLLALFSALVGFLFSQSINIIRYLRRPRFKIENNGNGYLYGNFGDPPHDPAELAIGFYLVNCGYNPAKNTRVFISELETAETASGPFEVTSLEFLELKRPIDLIPPSGRIVIMLGIIKSDNQQLELNLEHDGYSADTAEADTFYKRVFRAKIHVHCDDVNSSDTSQLIFDMKHDSWSEEILGEIEDSNIHLVT